MHKFKILLVTSLAVLAACSQKQIAPVSPTSSVESDGHSLTLGPVSIPVPKPVQSQPPFYTEFIKVPPSIKSLDAATAKVALKVLVIGGDPGIVDSLIFPEDYSALFWKAILTQNGIPFDLIYASQTTIDNALLIDSNNVGKYNAILLSNNQMVYQDTSAAPGTWVAGLDTNEWLALWQYEKDYGVRQVSAFTNTLYGVEDYCFTGGAAIPVGPTSSVFESLTAEGQVYFPYLKPSMSVNMVNTEVDPADVDSSKIPSVCSSVTPLLKDSSGKTLAAISNTTDGRERLAVMSAQNEYLTASQIIGYGLVKWATKGLFLGERKLFFKVDVDDWFLSSDQRPFDYPVPAPVPPTPFGVFRHSASDALATKKLQDKLRVDFSDASTFTIDIAFNGGGANLNAPASCDPNVVSVDPLSSMTRCLAKDFRWINHSWQHPKFDALSLYESQFQIRSNNSLASNMGLWYDRKILKSGELSGLGWYVTPPGSTSTEICPAPDQDPDNNNPKTDYGLSCSNPNLLQAAAGLGVKYVESNRSVPSTTPDCGFCGQIHPLDQNIFLTPTWPTNIFYYATTPEEAVAGYNSIYGPLGSAPAVPAQGNLTYEEYMAKETGIGFFHVITSPYPHFFHITNLREYSPGKNLVFEWIRGVMNNYSSYFQLPLRSPTWAVLSEYERSRRAAIDTLAAGATAIYDKGANTVTVTSPVAGKVFMTGAKFGSYEVYGGESQSLFTISAGQSVTFRPVAGGIGGLSLEIDTPEQIDHNSYY